MTFAIHYSNRFRKQYKKLDRSGDKEVVVKLKTVITLLSEGKSLPAIFHDHKLVGKLQDFRECHVCPDWLLIYKVYEDCLVLELVATGTHSELFK
jgi:mRNA interferase YafQ